MANTAEPLYVLNRSGNRPSHEQAAVYFDRAIALCRRAGFRRILLRGDTDFSQTEHLDRWDADGVRFLFGIDATPRLYVAEFSYRPAKCRSSYRAIVVWKDLEVYRGQKKLFDDSRCFFYITNAWGMPTEDVVFGANERCDQENLVQQLKSGVRSLSAPVDNLVSNWAYMVMGSLAWSLKAWAALLLPEKGRWQEKHREEKRKLLRMDFTTFRRALVNVPAQIVRTGRKILYRLLTWNPWQHVFFRLLDQLRQPLRC